MEGLIEGRIVHFVLPDGKHRPGIIVKVWQNSTAPENGMSNLLVVCDPSDDVKSGVFQYETSRPYSEDPKPGTWHWIEKA